MILAQLVLIALGFGGFGLYLAGSGVPVPGQNVLAPLLVAALASAAAGVLLAVIITRNVERSAALLTQAAHRLGGGRLEERFEGRLAQRLPSELVDLAAGFNAMAAGVERLVREVQTERERLFAVLERSADGVLAVDDEGRLRFLNAAGCRLLELRERDVIAEIEHERSFMAVTRNHELDGLLRSCRASGVQQTQVLQLGRRRRAVEAIFLPLRGAGAWQFLGLLHDLTEMRRVEGQRRDFVSNVSHELRTPLASIRAAVEVLLDGALGDPVAAREFVEAVNGEVDRLWQLVEELLELGRIESGAVPFQFGAVASADLCAEAVRRLGPQAERAGVSLTWWAEPELAPIHADGERLLRALINLVHNAIKFTDAGGSVQIEARACGAEAEISVRDTGSGIPQAELDRIFERFYKVDRARSGAGTGLGLAIVKHTLQAHGGRVEVESSPGEGSNFRLYLPWAHEPAGARPLNLRALG